MELKKGGEDVGLRCCVCVYEENKWRESFPELLVALRIHRDVTACLSHDDDASATQTTNRQRGEQNMWLSTARP